MGKQNNSQRKENVESPRKEISENEACNMTEKEFRVMVMEFIHRMDEKINNLCKNQEEMKSDIATIKNTMESFNSRLQEAEDRISELEDQVQKQAQAEQQLEKKIKKQEESLRELRDNMKRSNMRIIGLPEGQEEQQGLENLFEEIMTENFPDMGKIKVTQYPLGTVHSYYNTRGPKFVQGARPSQPQLALIAPRSPGFVQKVIRMVIRKGVWTLPSEIGYSSVEEFVASLESNCSGIEQGLEGQEATRQSGEGDAPITPLLLPLPAAHTSASPGYLNLRWPWVAWGLRGLGNSGGSVWSGWARLGAGPALLHACRPDGAEGLSVTAILTVPPNCPPLLAIHALRVPILVAIMGAVTSLFDHLEAAILIEAWYMGGANWFALKGVPDQDGSIDFLGFTAAVNLVVRGKMEEKLKWYFKLYDADGNGSIDKKELLNIFMTVQALNGQQTLSPENSPTWYFIRLSNLQRTGQAPPMDQHLWHNTNSTAGLLEVSLGHHGHFPYLDTSQGRNNIKVATSGLPTISTNDLGRFAPAATATHWDLGCFAPTTAKHLGPGLLCSSCCHHPPGVCSEPRLSCLEQTPTP
ncbi:hypothetical protein QTO34_014423, partial [Cnephaeus nilssonii]